MVKGAEAARADGFAGEVKILTSCPSCLQGLSRYDDDAGTSADYVWSRWRATARGALDARFRRKGEPGRDRARPPLRGACRGGLRGGRASPTNSHPPIARDRMRPRTPPVDCELCHGAGGTSSGRLTFAGGGRGRTRDPRIPAGGSKAHVREMTDLAETDRNRLMAVVFAVEAHMRQSLEPDKMNLAALET